MIMTLKKLIQYWFEMNFLADFCWGEWSLSIENHFYWCCGSLGIWGQIPDHRTVKEIISVWWNPTCHFKKNILFETSWIYFIASGCLTSCVRSCCMDLSGWREDTVIFMSPIFRRQKLYIFIRAYKAGRFVVEFLWIIYILNSGGGNLVFIIKGIF